MSKKWRGTAAFFLMAVLPAAGRAHVRNYLDTYGYETLAKGHSELEIHTDLNDPDGGDRYWYNQTEAEYGVTSRWTTALYGVFVDGLGFTAAKWENRYRLGEKGKGPVDVALYGELKKANGHKDEDEIEAKVILAKDWGRVNLAVNPILELEREVKANGEDEWELESGLAAGVSYHRLWGAVTPGVEILLKEKQSRLTPGLYIDLMPNVRFNVGVGIGLEPQADDAQLKTLLEIEF
jgi:hypothetical protein